MPNDVNLFAFPIVRLTLAYLLHSTLLLGGTWLFLRVARVRSWALRERMWKLAVIVPLITAAMPLPAAWSRSAGRLSFERFVPELPSAESDVAQVEEPKRVPIVAVGLSADVDKTLDVDDAPRAAEPRMVGQGPRLKEYGGFRPTFFANVRSTEGGPALAKPRWPHPTTRTPETEPRAVEGSFGAAAVTAICYTVLTFFILGTLHVIRRSLVFARSLRDCRPVLDESICAVLADVLYRANVRRRVRLLVSAADRAPAAFGIFRWTIVLPQALIPTLKPDELRALLGHEVAHLARGDALWLWIGRILCACCAFQPLNFLARAQLRLAAEFLSDEWAVRNSANRFALARCLTRVAEWSAHLEPQSLELAAVGSRSNLSDRVERLILEPRRTDFWDVGRRRWLVWAAALLAAFGLECSAPRTSLLAEPPSGAPNGAIAETQPDIQPVTKPTLDDALQSLSEETRDLLSDLKQVDRLLRQSIPSDSAIEIITGRLEWRAARLAETQARLTRHREPASKHAHAGTEPRGPSHSGK
jgi:beta-lactamase regulating signal transducer with metallopeptidase domain